MELKPGYKQSEVGVIPVGWGVSRLSDVASVRGGIAKNSNVVISNPITAYYLRVANVQDGYLDLSEMSQLEISRDELNKHSVLSGDVLMNEGGDKDKLGRGSIWSGQFDPCVHQNHVFVVRCKKNLLPEFLDAWTGASVARNYFLFAGKQTTNLASISKSSLEALPVVTPSIPEQAAIASALRDVDALLAAQDALIAKKNAVKLGSMQELLTGQRRLPGFRGKWIPQRLGDAAILKARIGWQGLTTAEYLDSGDYYLVTGTDFKNGKIDWANCHYVTQSRHSQDTYIQARPRDVLVTKDGTIGKVALVGSLDKPATLNSGVFVIRPKTDSFSPEFFYFLLLSNLFEKFLSQLSAGSTINHLYQKDFVSFNYRLPPTTEEQTAIAKILTDMDSEISALQFKREKTALLKQGMMQELLTGKTRLV